MPKKTFILVARYILIALALFIQLKQPMCAQSDIPTQLPDSIIEEAALLAARSEVRTLRPLYRQYGSALPPSVRLYCDLALAQADRRLTDVISCIDSLIGHNSKEIDLRARLSLSLLKAETLRRMGAYIQLVDFCRNQLQYYRSRRVSAILLEPFQSLEKKGQRLSGTAMRALALGMADRDEAFELADHYGSLLSEMDTYANLRCNLLLDEAFNHPREAATCAYRLLTEQADSLSNDDRAHCLQTMGSNLMILGAWKELAENCRHLAIKWRGKNEMLSRYNRLANTFDVFGPTTCSNLSKGSSIPLSPSNESPLITALIRGNAAVNLSFHLGLGINHTIITETDAHTAGIIVAPDTVEIISTIGLVQASPAIVPLLRIGDIKLRNVLVYVIKNSSEHPATLLRAIGLTELARMGTIDLYPDHVILGKITGDSDTAKANIRFSSLRELILSGKLNNRPAHFICNTTCPDFFITPEAARSKIKDLSSPICIGIGKSTLRLVPSIDELQDTGLDGILGQSFFNAAKHVRLDFNRMRLDLQATH